MEGGDTIINMSYIDKMHMIDSMENFFYLMK